jgi:hypothetical protein
MVPVQITESAAFAAGGQLCEIFAGFDGWNVRTPEGESIGPFAALRDVEDWLDARDHQVPPIESFREVKALAAVQSQNASALPGELRRIGAACPPDGR